MRKMETLANYLECEVEELKQGYNENVYELGNQEYLVLTEEEREEAAKVYIRETLWAFNTGFILQNSNIDFKNADYDRVLKAFKKIQEELCEDANEVVYAILRDFEEFCEVAVDTDGYGHFLSPYDGEEIEQEEYFIYRMN